MTRGARILAVAALVLAPLAAQALTLEFPGPATRAAEEVKPLTSYALPMSAWKGDGLETLQAEGAVVKQAWQLPVEGLTTLQILKPLRDQLDGAGYETLFECDADSCGGFDFRYANDVLPEPAMHVDLGDFRVLTARKLGLEAPEYICLLVSRSSTRGFVQVVHIGPETKDDVSNMVVTSTKTPDATVAPADAVALAERLERDGHLVLHDVEFATGTSQLNGAEYGSLGELADYLLANPNRKIMLVGHTDATGSLSGNVALSRKRAQSVAEYLVGALGVPNAQVSADGVGYLSPMASNLTDDGRDQNRRVEVILTSTE